MEDDNRNIQFKVGEMLNNYMTQIEANPGYIAYDILDSCPDSLTTDTIESLYQRIENWIDQIKVTLSFDALKKLDRDYDRIYVFFDKNFEERLDNLTQVVDREHPLKAPL